MTLLRNLHFYLYFFGYMLTHMRVLRQGEAALKAGDEATLRAIVNEHVPHWCSHLLHIAGVTVVCQGAEHLPQGRPCVFVVNHRSYADIPVVLTQLGDPCGILAKKETQRLPLVNRWMRLLGCVFVDRDDPRAGLRALNDATAIVKGGGSFIIFPEGTRYQGQEGGIGEFKGGAIRIATKAGAPLVPVAISGSRFMMEARHYLIHPCRIVVRILPPIETKGLDRAAQKELPAQLQQQIQAALVDPAHWLPEENPYTRHYTQNPELPKQKGTQ